MQTFISNKTQVMRDQCKNGHESALAQLRHREEEIIQEINHDITGMHDDLMQLVNDFTFVLSGKAEKDCAFGCRLLSDVKLQLRRLDETIAVISCFSGVLQQFNSMTSKVLAVEMSDLCDSNTCGTDEEMPVTLVQEGTSEIQNIRFSQKSAVGKKSHEEGDFSDEVIIKNFSTSKVSVVEDVLGYSDKRKRIFSDIDVDDVKGAQKKGGC